MDYVYLDWNVIQYMKNSTVQGAIDGPNFYELVRKLSKKYKFPFSEGHLKDLVVSFNDRNQENINSDLEYLNTLSQGYALGIIQENGRIIPMKKDVDIHKLFDDIASEYHKTLEFKVSGNSYSVDMTSLPTNDLFRPYLENSSGALNPDVMCQLINDLLKNNDDPDFYKKFRKQISDLKSNLENRDTIIDKGSNYYKKFVLFLDFISSENPDIYIDSFDNVIKAFCSINGRSFEKMTTGDKIELSYSILDFNPKFMDKIKNKNRPSNISRDCKNLYFASQAKYFVTEDKSAFKKGIFVCKALSLRVKLTSMSDFMAKFC
jgi:hypothetical protein